MGTRNLTMVVIDGEFKVAQYGQWDGYPSGQGRTVVDFLNTKMNRNLFCANLRKARFLTDEEINQTWVDCGADPNTTFVSMEIADKHGNLYPHLSRDTGAKILELVQLSDSGIGLKDSLNFANDSLFCEYAYLLDMDNDILEVYKGFINDPLDENERFYRPDGYDKEINRFLNDGELPFYPIRLVAKFTFEELKYLPFETFVSTIDPPEEDETE